MRVSDLNIELPNRPTTIAGLFLRHGTFGEVRKFQEYTRKLAEDKTEGADQRLTLYLFEHFVVDEEGVPFEGVEEDIEDLPSFLTAELLKSFYQRPDE